jgi:alpha-galactosidase
MAYPVITFIGAGSAVFTKNIAGDILQRPALAGAEVRLMDINPERLAESEIIVGKMAQALGGKATIKTYTNQRRALEGADFVVCCFQVGGYEPCTVTDFEVPKAYGLRQTIADTMAINTWAIAAKYPTIRQVGLCHSVQGTAWELARDLDIPVEDIRYRAGGINHMAFYLNFEHRQPDGSYIDLYPALKKGYAEGRFPKPSHWNPRCPNKVRYEMLTRLGYFVTESSEHFAEYTPWFIKRDRPDLIEKFGIPLDEYPKRCVEQIARWKREAESLKSANTVELKESHEYASQIVNSVVTGEPSVIYGNIANRGFIPQLPEGCAVEVPTLVDSNGLQPTVVKDIPPQLIALMRTNINVQELTVAALVQEKPEHIYHAAMLDPHTGAELDLDQIWNLTHDLLAAHGDWLPEWARVQTRKAS